MRYGVISDVHGNIHALQAAITTLQREEVDGYLSAGDLVGYGPYPNECVRTVHGALGALGVAGNHDLIVLDRLPDKRCVPLARRTQEWTRERLDNDVREQLTKLPRAYVDKDLVVAHGSLTDPEEYVRSERRAGELLELLGERYPGRWILVLGHTHVPWVYDSVDGTIPLSQDATVRLDPSRRYLLNPGSVGQSRQWEYPPRARFMTLDLDHRLVRFFVRRYDYAASLEALRRAGHSRKCIHLLPRLGASTLRRVGRLVP